MSELKALEKAIEFVRKSNSEFNIACLDVILGNDIETNVQKLLDYYVFLQNEDGGFPHQRKRKQISTINVTTGTLHTMLDYGLGDSKPFQLGIKFLKNRQESLGYWNEPQALQKLKPPKWDDPTNELVRIWLTANTCHLLARIYNVTSPILTKGINFLLKNRENSGKLKGYFHANWIAVAIFGIINGTEDELTNSFARIVEKNLEKILGTSDLAWCLHCFHNGGFKKEHPLVHKMLDNLISIQNDDGRWISVDGNEFDISTTVYILHILKKFGKF